MLRNEPLRSPTLLKYWQGKAIWPRSGWISPKMNIWWKWCLQQRWVMIGVNNTAELWVSGVNKTAESSPLPTGSNRLAYPPPPPPTRPDEMMVTAQDWSIFCKRLLLPFKGNHSKNALRWNCNAQGLYYPCFRLALAWRKKLTYRRVPSTPEGLKLFTGLNFSLPVGKLETILSKP
jgi:hypothetical protein